MGISTIPNPKFVFCVKCKYRTKKKVFNKNKPGHTMQYFCDGDWLVVVRPLYGQKGCVDGKRRMK